MNSKIQCIWKKLEQKNLDGLILSSPFNISYLTKFTSRDAYLVMSKKENIYITDSRYIQEAKDKLSSNVRLKKINGSVFRIIVDVCKNLRLKNIGFEERNLSFGEYEKIRENFNEKMDFVPTYGLIEELRQIKTPLELKNIKKAIEISCAALRFIKKFILAGKREIEIAAELERFIRYNGAVTSAFEIIVASGPNSSFPHHITSLRRIANNEPILVDMGVNYLGYKSDLTRIFFLGKISPSLRRVYDTVQRAQEKAIREIEPGVIIKKIDKTARQYIAEQGYGGFFGHNLGHGIGLEVHEEPHISKKENNKLKEGMVFTVEPGIYLPHKFGIRLEDMVLVTPKGSEVLSAHLNK